MLTITQGGFARVYEVFDDSGLRRAVKVVNKASIRTKKNKTKVRSGGGLFGVMEVVLRRSVYARSFLQHLLTPCL